MRLIWRAGHVSTVAALAPVASRAAYVHHVFVDFVFWIAVRSVSGFCFAGLIVTVESC